VRRVANCYTPFTLLYFLLYEIGDVIGARARHVTRDDVTIRGVAEPRLSESGRARRRRLFGRAGARALVAGRARVLAAAAPGDNGVRGVIGC